MTYEELNKIWADNGKGVMGLKYVYQQGREDTIDGILSICHHAFTVSEVIEAIKQLKGR